MAFTYHIITYGCQMNKNDSERLVSVLEQIGLQPTSDVHTANVVVLNSCSVRQTAEDRIYGTVRELDLIRKREKRDVIIAVTGCMAGRDRKGVMEKKLPGADLFFPTRDMVQLPRWIAELRPELVSSTPELGVDYLNIRPKITHEHKAFISIQTGCNWFCTYCVVPYARGMEGYRSLKSILNEAREYDAHGILEITVLGQTVNHYQAPDPECFSSANPYKNHFAALLWELNQLQNVRRIHCTSMHPMHLLDEVIDAFGLPKHVNYIHLPVQAGNNEVLQRMNRKYKVEEYLERINRIKARYPTMTLATDIIVGFCGETPEQFEDTVALYKNVDFDICYTAMYSPRTGTLGFKLFEDDVTREEKKRRWRIIQNLMEETVLRKNETYVGRTLEVLADEYKGGVCRGNSRELKMVKFPGTRDDIGKIRHVKIEKAMEWVLEGIVV